MLDDELINVIGFVFEQKNQCSIEKKIVVAIQFQILLFVVSTENDDDQTNLFFSLSSRLVSFVKQTSTKKAIKPFYSFSHSFQQQQKENVFFSFFFFFSIQSFDESINVVTDEYSSTELSLQIEFNFE